MGRERSRGGADFARGRIGRAPLRTVVALPFPLRRDRVGHTRRSTPKMGGGAGEDPLMWCNQPRVAALIVTGFVLATFASCGPVETPGATSTEGAPGPDASATAGTAAAPSPTPAATISARIPGPVLPTPLWSEVHGGRDYSDSRGYVVDVGAGKALEVDVPPSAPPDVQTGTLAWSPSSRVLVRVWSAGLAGPTGWVRQRAVDLYVGEPGGELRYLVTLDELVAAADWTPDGDLIALQTGSAVLVLDATSGAPIAEFPSVNVLHATGWSGDGRLLAFESQHVGVNEITLWDRDDGSKQTISGFYADWAPHTNKLAYVAGSRAPGTTEQTAEIRVRDFASGADERVGSLPEVSTLPRLAWSPDGTTVAVTVRGNAGNGVHLFDTTVSRQHTFVRNGGVAGWLDGSTLVVMGNECSTADVLVVNADGSLSDVTGGAGAYDGAPSMAPDGHSLAITTVSSDLNTVYVRLIDLHGHSSRDPVVATRNYLLAGAWSPDERYLVLIVWGSHEGGCYGGDIPDTSVEVVP